MGVQYDSDRDRFVVRRREDGGKRCRRFKTKKRLRRSTQPSPAAAADPASRSHER